MVEVLGRYSKLPPTPEIRPSKPRNRRSDQVPPRIHSVYRRLSPDQIAQLVAEYEAGSRVAALAQSYDIGKATVTSILRDHNVKLRNQGLPPEHLPEAVARYEAGESLARIGDYFHCDANVIRRHLIAAGVTIRPRNGFGSK